jgi:hypothetical protein
MKYNSFERKIAFFFTKFPVIKLAIKKAYQKLNYLRYKKKYTFKSDYELTTISYQDKESFFGYYDKSPINITNEYIIFQSTNTNTMELTNPNIPIDLILYDIGNDSYEAIDKCYSYNWQQGTKLMWLNKFKFIFNNYDKNRNIYISKIHNIETKEFRVLDFPIYDCYKDRFAISLNFDRLKIGRADYSYSNRNAIIDWSNNDNDGLYFIDFQTNCSVLIITLNTIIKFNYKNSMSYAKHKFNHIMISPDGKKMMFMHRWFLSSGQRYDTLYVSNIDGSNINMVADDEMVSHCYWYNNSSIFAYLRDNEYGNNYYLIDIESCQKKRIGEGVIDGFGDGHPSVFGNKILFDTYPNKARMKELFLFDYVKSELIQLGEFYESFNYYGETRCDLHPRFSFDGKKVFFDSVHSGKRQLYMMELVH